MQLPIPPRVSIIIPVYNAEEFLEECIESILSQSFPCFEILFIDDVSVDESVSIIEEHMSKDTRIHLFKQDKNRGAPSARNRGIRMAKGEFLMFVDADDMLIANCLDELIQVGDHLLSDAIKGTMLVYNEDLKQLKQHSLNQTATYENTNLSSCSEIQHLYQYQTYLFRTSIIKTNQIEFDTDLKNFQDPTFLSQLLPRCERIDVLMAPVYVRRVRTNSIITSDWNLYNYLSMTNGVSRAYSTLINNHQEETARLMALTFSRWWRKLELTPLLLQRSECMEVYRQIRDIAQTFKHPIYQFTWTKVGAYHSLKLISEGKLEEAYRKIRARSRLRSDHVVLFVKAVDIATYFYAKIRNRI